MCEEKTKNEIQTNIASPNKTIALILVRGLPGSGKSTKAKSLAQARNAIHLEADQFFINQQGEYCFDANLLAQAHAWCLAQTKAGLEQGKSVVVANTFVRHWQMQPYRALAKSFAIKLEVIVCRGQFQNIHGVPQATIDMMRQKWQE